jgi:hypothetical protein
MNAFAGAGFIMRIIKGMLAVALALVLAACGSGGCDAGSSPLTGSTACGTTTGTGGGTTAPTATRLVLQLSKLNVNNSGGEDVTATATATTAGGQTITGVPVTFSVDANALYTPADTATNSNGVVTATVAIGSDHSNRLITVTAISGALRSTASFAVTGAVLAGTPVPTVVLPSEPGKVNFSLKDANAAPMAGQAISITAGSLGTTTGVTDSNGAFVYNYTAPAAPGTLDINASAGGATVTATVIVQASPGAIPAVTTPILSASVSANPSVVATNSAATNNRTEIRALFLGANNLPIKNVRVLFDLDGDANSIGGTFSTGSNLVYSDANGVATTAYIPASRSSPTNGLTIRACYGSVDFSVCDPSKVTKTTITVTSEPLSVTIGSNNVVTPGANNLTYIASFVVLVVDASGRAKANVEIVPSIDLPYFLKGYYSVPGAWTNTPRDLNGNIIRQPVACLNEDINRNGVLEVGEDLDLDSVLEPRKSDVAVSMIGSTKTDAAGLAYLQIEYPQNIGSWAQVQILVSAAGISGTEGRATWTETLRVPEAAITATASPPFEVSPYGQVTTSLNDPTDSPDRGVVAPCLNKN